MFQLFLPFPKTGEFEDIIPTDSHHDNFSIEVILTLDQFIQLLNRQSVFSKNFPTDPSVSHCVQPGCRKPGKGFRMFGYAYPGHGGFTQSDYFQSLLLSQT